MRKRYNIKSKLAGMRRQPWYFLHGCPGISRMQINLIRLSLNLIPKTVRESSFPVIAAWHPAGLWREICLWQMDTLGVL